jgi:hypothetical protein
MQASRSDDDASYRSFFMVCRLMKIRIILLWLMTLLCAGCGSQSAAPDTTTLAHDLCDRASRSRPVSVDLLVTVFRQNGITLEITNRCDTSVDATNSGPSGLEPDVTVSEREGVVLCTLLTKDVGWRLDVNRYEGDQETHFVSLNVVCTLYPSNEAQEHTQVERVRAAMNELIRAVEARG